MRALKEDMPAVRQAARPLRGQAPLAAKKRVKVRLNLWRLREHVKDFAERLVPALDRHPTLADNICLELYPQGVPQLQAELQRDLARMRQFAADLETRPRLVTDRDAFVAGVDAFSFSEVSLHLWDLAHPEEDDDDDGKGRFLCTAHE